MNASKYLFMAATILTVAACKGKTEEIKSDKFVLTDTMARRISFDTVKRQQVENELKLTGKITPEDNKMANVYAIVGGFVTDVNVTLGDFVQKGQVLAVIRSTEIADYEKQLREAESDLALAEKNLKVANELYESKLNSERDVVAAQKELDNAKAELARIQEVMRIYRISKSSIYNVVAPISGFVVDKNITSALQLPSGMTDHIFTIAQIDEVFVTANVYETDISKISLNMPAQVEMLSYPGKMLSGKVDKILNIIDPDTRTLKVRIKLPNPGFALKPDMASTVYLHYTENQQMPAVPAESIVFDKSLNYIMVYHRADSIETRQVEPYRTTGGKTYIQSGLNVGEKIIVKNALMVYDAIND